MVPSATAPDNQDADRLNLPKHTHSALVASEGAVITAGEAEVVIPKGALAEPVEIVVETVDSGFGALPNAEEEQILAFLPHGTQFLKPVTISIPHEHDSIDGLTLFTTEPDQPWAVVDGATFTEDHAQADVTHFSFFFASPTPASEIVGSSGSGGSGGSGGASSTGGSSGENGEAGTSSVESGGSGGQGSAGTSSEPDTNGSAGQGGTASLPASGPDAGVSGGGTSGNVDPGEDEPDGPGTGGFGGASGLDAGAPSSGGNAGEGDGTPGGGDTGSGGFGGAPIGDAGVGFDLNYAGFGQWVGYTSATADDSSVIEHARMCAAGVVTLDPELLAFASWNWNVNQAFDGEPEAWIPTSEFIDYDIETSGEPLQLVLLDDQDNTWCLPLPGDAGSARLVDFTSSCDGSGDFFDGVSGIVSVSLVVPSNAEHDQDFDFCVSHLNPQQEGPPPSFPGFDGGVGAGGGASSGGASSGPDAGVGEPGPDGPGGDLDAGAGGAPGSGGAPGHDEPPSVDAGPI